MKVSYLVLVLLVAGMMLTAVGCATAPTPTPVPTPVPTKAPPTAAPLPTVPPTTVSPTTVPPATAASSTSSPASSAVPATSSPATATPTKASASGPATLAPIKETPVLPTGTPKSADDMLEVTPQQIKAMIDGKADIIIVDAQPAEAYVLGHIPGAVNVPWDTKIKAPSGLDKNKLIVLYCGCAPDAKPSQSDSGDVAMQLYTTYGYRKLATLKGGWDTWQQLGLPIEKGK